MLITTIQELRLYFPTHAIDHIEAFSGFIENSEHEFLLNPLGQPLYEKLCQWYEEQKESYVKSYGNDLGYYNRLLLMAQRCVAFDAMSRSIDQQSISMNNAGINMSLAEDYKPADSDAIARAKLSYIKEAHSSLNRLLYTLEQWTSICPDAEDVEPVPHEKSKKNNDYDLYEIVNFWRSSRYFYLCAQLLIPSSVVLQEYLNIYDSREKFIQMLPDLHFIQEEQIAPAIGEDFTEAIVGMQISGGTKRDATAAYASSPKSLADDANIDPMMRRILHKLRKIMATLLESRTSVINVDKQRKIDAHDEGVRLLGSFCDYCRQHQDSIITALGDNAEAYHNSPLYIKPQPEPDTNGQSSMVNGQCSPSDFNNSDMALHVTIPLL